MLLDLGKACFAQSIESNIMHTLLETDGPSLLRLRSCQYEVLSRYWRARCSVARVHVVTQLFDDQLVPDAARTLCVLRCCPDSKPVFELRLPHMRKQPVADLAYPTVAGLAKSEVISKRTWRKLADGTSVHVSLICSVTTGPGSLVVAISIRKGLSYTVVHLVQIVEHIPLLVARGLRFCPENISAIHRTHSCPFGSCLLQGQAAALAH